MEGKPHSHRLRLGRYSEPGRIYLLTANCYVRLPKLSGAAAASIVLDTLHWLDQAGRMELHAAVVMPDHLHFIAGLRQEPLDRLMHSVKRHSAAMINRVCGERGRLWQPGYHDRALRDEESLEDVVGYCLMNPQRAGLVADFREYPFLWCRWGI